MPASFISERTAEMIFIPELLKTLKSFYAKITRYFKGAVIDSYQGFYSCNLF